MINKARSETVYTKRPFKDAVVSHHRAIPVNGFIDWATDGEENKCPSISHCQMCAPFSATSLANWRKVGNKRALREIRERWRQR
jgi:putative SOS response-associated peptidase YedK